MGETNREEIEGCLKEEMVLLQDMTNNYTRELSIFYREHFSNCSLCGHAFCDGETAHLGYIEHRRHAFLCDRCSGQLIETVCRYYWTAREYESPLQTDILWRYMDLSKFISLIGKCELYFSSAAYFDDPFEGAKGITSRKVLWDAFYSEFLRHAVRTAPGRDENLYPDDKIEAEVQTLLRNLQSSGEKDRDITFINCWHMNSYESEAMWRLYSKDITNAIAVRTTTKRLYHALNKDPAISIGKVTYIDFGRRFTSINGAFWYKQISFEHEKEVRLIAKSYGRPRKAGISFPVDINMLIVGIYVSPYAPSWFCDVVEDVLKKYGIKKSVLQSQMKATPFY